MARRGSLGPLSAGALLAVALTAGCGGTPAAGAAQDATPPAVSSLTVSAATAVLTAFDQADSAASTAGDLTALKAQETSPELDVSVAAARRALAAKHPEPGFKHASPAFAIPAGQSSCFLVGASLQETGDELARTDLSQFLKQPDGGWKISHNLQVTAADAALVKAIGGQTAKSTDELVDPARLQALSTEVFARTTATGTPDQSVVAASPVLDQQLAAGWGVYTTAMSGAGMAVNRKLSDASWSPCAATVDGQTLTLLTLRATDVITPTKAGGTATLSPMSPDLVGTGQTTAAHGTEIDVARVEMFLLAVPTTGGPARVLALDDAPLTVTSK